MRVITAFLIVWWSAAKDWWLLKPTAIGASSLDGRAQVPPAISPPGVLQVYNERMHGTGSGWRTAVRFEGRTIAACVDAIDS
jgi:hypothetical protein